MVFRLLDWFTNYLHDRKQRVVVEGSSSSWLSLNSGVPQGSILGPVLFLLFTNDMGHRLSDRTSLYMYEDDAKIYLPIQL